MGALIAYRFRRLKIMYLIVLPAQYHDRIQHAIQFDMNL